MGANGYTPAGVNAASIRQGLGYVPPTAPKAGTGVTVSAGDTPSIAVNAAALPIPSISFAAGAPAGTPAEGALYFNITPTPYVGYVGHSGSWHQF